jgi:hypothetical protein
MSNVYADQWSGSCFHKARPFTVLCNNLVPPWVVSRRNSPSTLLMVVIIKRCIRVRSLKPRHNLLLYVSHYLYEKNFDWNQGESAN